MTLLNKAAILGAVDRVHQDVEVSEWGGTVRVIGLSGTDRDAFEAAVIDARQAGKGSPSASVRLQNFRAKLLVKCLIDEDGKRIFADSEAKALGEKSGLVVDRLFDVARKLSGMDDKAVEEGKDGSEPDQSDSSTSD